MQTLAVQLDAARRDLKPYRHHSNFLASYPWRNGVVLDQDAVHPWISQHQPSSLNRLLLHIINVRAISFRDLGATL